MLHFEGVETMGDNDGRTSPGCSGDNGESESASGRGDHVKPIDSVLAGSTPAPGTKHGEPECPTCGGPTSGDNPSECSIGHPMAPPGTHPLALTRCKGQVPAYTLTGLPESRLRCTSIRNHAGDCSWVHSLAIGWGEGSPTILECDRNEVMAGNRNTTVLASGYTTGFEVRVEPAFTQTETRDQTIRANFPAIAEAYKGLVDDGADVASLRAVLGELSNLRALSASANTAVGMLPPAWDALAQLFVGVDDRLHQVERCVDEIARNLTELTKAAHDVGKPSPRRRTTRKAGRRVRK